mgnify:CR=1 FL=1
MNNELPMGVSQWKMHGERFGYDKFFRNKFEKKYNKLKAQVERCLEYCKQQNGLSHCKNCCLDASEIK